MCKLALLCISTRCAHLSVWSPRDTDGSQPSVTLEREKKKKELYLPFDCVFHWNFIKEYFTLFTVLCKTLSSVKGWVKTSSRKASLISFPMGSLTGSNKVTSRQKDTKLLTQSWVMDILTYAPPSTGGCGKTTEIIHFCLFIHPFNISPLVYV